MGTDRVEEIEEEEPLIPTPGLETASVEARSVKTKVPEAELRVYKQGKGPIDVYKTGLGGWDQDQIEVREILDKYGFKTVYAFSPGSGRGVPIRFNQRNGRSLLTYRDGAVIYIDGEPKSHTVIELPSNSDSDFEKMINAYIMKDSLINPITKILLGVVFITFMITYVMKEAPGWAKKLNFSGGRFPPWILACAVIVFTRMRKRTKSFLGKYIQ